ncbi:hypothetical protein BLA29_006515 [Euroglyphus maynei]|uniref:Uncharacterized protein n=1 Tax=Euroglyphus maynei TaxID=6958 RepID=A0A1Y3B0R8_EURMA|nr:hypothetical protein BLA29_006515 [Euroglyphus maynei]
MTDRRAELEKKKLKLQQLRELKEQRRNDKYRDRDFMSDLGLGQHQTNRTSSAMMTNIINNNNNNPTNVNSNSLNNNNNNNNNNSMSSSLTSIPGDSSIRDVDELLESVGSALSLSNSHQNQQQQQSTTNDMTISEDGSSLSSSVASNQTKTLGTNSSAAAVKLGLASFPPVLIAPKEQVTYEKQTQTTATSTTSNNDSTGSTGNDGRSGPVDYYESI